MNCGYLHLGSIADTGYFGYLSITHTAVCVIPLKNRYCIGIAWILEHPCASRLAPSVIALLLAAQLPLAALSGAVLPPAASDTSATGGPNAHLEHSDPLSPPHEPLTRSDNLLDVTYIYPQPTVETELLVPTVPSLEVTGVGVVTGPLSGDLAAPSDSLQSSRSPQPLSPPPSSPSPPSPLASSVTPAPSATQLPSAALPDAVVPPAVASPPITGDPNGHLDRPGSPSPPHEPLSRADSSLDVTYIHPQAALEMEPLTSTTPSSRDVMTEAALPLTAGSRVQEDPAARSDPLALPQLPPTPLPLAVPPSTGDEWKCRCRPHQKWEDRRRCAECAGLWCAACVASQCRCEPELFRQPVALDWMTHQSVLLLSHPEIPSPPPSPADTSVPLRMPEESLAPDGDGDDALPPAPLAPLPPAEVGGLPGLFPMPHPDPDGSPTRFEGLLGVTNVHPPSAALAPSRSLFGPPIDGPLGTLSGPGHHLPLTNPTAPVVSAAPSAVVQTELPMKPSRPSAATTRDKSVAGATDVRPPDADLAQPVAASLSSTSTLLGRDDPKAQPELPEKPRRSFGPASRSKVSVDVASAPATSSPADSHSRLATEESDVQSELPARPARKRSTEQPPTAATAITPDDLLTLLATKKEAAPSELPEKPSRKQPSEPPPPTDAEALAPLADEKRLAKNAKAREKNAEKRKASLQAAEDAEQRRNAEEKKKSSPAAEDADQVYSELSLELLEEFDKASVTAKVSDAPKAPVIPAAKGKSSFTKQPAGIPDALHAKVASGRVSSLSTSLNSPHDSADDSGTSDAISEHGGETYAPTAGEYVQVKMTSPSFVKGRIMLVQRVRDRLCTLRQIGSADVPGAKKVNVSVKALHDIKRNGVTVDIYLNAVNLQDYLNLRVENPTLPEVPPPART